MGVAVSLGVRAWRGGIDHAKDPGLGVWRLSRDGTSASLVTSRMPGTDPLGVIAGGDLAAYVDDRSRAAEGADHE